MKEKKKNNKCYNMYFWVKAAASMNIHTLASHTETVLLRASKRSERSEHTVVLSLRFYYIYIYIYSVTKILRKIRATTFTENYGKLRVREMSAWDERMLLPISLDNAILYPFATS